jgi:hypothetical protein
MRIAYVNTDEVNQDLAVRTAVQHGAVIFSLAPEGPSPDGLFDAVLYNLDDVPQGHRFPLLEGLRYDEPHMATAVHGYDITDEQVQTLKRNGVGAARRLHPGLLCDLFIAARKRGEAVQQNDAATELTWVNLAK